MEKRVLIAIVLCILVLVLWEKFFIPKRQPAPPSTSPTVEQTPTAPAQPEKVEPAPAPMPASEAPAVSTPSFPTPATHTGRDVVVETPLYRAVFTETGARLRSFVLEHYRETIDKDSPGKELVKTSKIEDLPLAFNFVDRPVAALNLAPYVADRTSATISDGQNQKLTFSYEAPGWLRITRQYLFNADSYLIDLTVSVENLGSQPWENAPTLGLINLPLAAGSGSRYTFQGPSLLVNGELEEVKFKKIEGEKQIPGPIDWAAYTGQYFLMALLPVNLTPNHAQLKALDPATQMVETTLIGPKIALQPGVQQQFSYQLYLGPKEVSILEAANPLLAKAVNFGWFDIIAQPLLVCLKFFYRLWPHNYGVAIILLTLLIKILFWPLTHKSYVSMQAMKKLQPKMQKIREKYKDDKEKMNQEVMQMYRTHKVNPVGGCLPMVLQIPVFFALYRLLYSSIAIRHAPFIWWINDLAAPDRLPVGFKIPIPYWNLEAGLPVLTILMGISMFIQQKMTPMSGDPRQEKMMMMMPIFMTVMFIAFPSGLVLYWLVNNILSIGQQYYINKRAA